MEGGGEGGGGGGGGGGGKEVGRGGRKRVDYHRKQQLLNTLSKTREATHLPSPSQKELSQLDRIKIPYPPPPQRSPHVCARLWKKRNLITSEEESCSPSAEIKAYERPVPGPIQNGSRVSNSLMALLLASLFPSRLLLFSPFPTGTRSAGATVLSRGLFRPFSRPTPGKAGRGVEIAYAQERQILCWPHATDWDRDGMLIPAKGGWADEDYGYGCALWWVSSRMLMRCT